VTCVFLIWCPRCRCETSAHKERSSNNSERWYNVCEECLTAYGATQPRPGEQIFIRTYTRVA